MKPVSTMNKGDIIKRMFPYHVRITYKASFTDYDAPLDEREPQIVEHELGDLPCSVQTAVANNGQVIENEYIILCPCIDMTPKNQVPDDADYAYFSLVVTMNGKVNKASNTEILSVDNLPVYEVGGYAVGCKIRVKVKNHWTW